MCGGSSPGHFGEMFQIGKISLGSFIRKFKKLSHLGAKKVTLKI